MGSEEGRAAGAYVERRLRRIGGCEVFVLDMPTWALVPVRCELTVDTVTVELAPMSPNISVAPVTGEEGISGPLRYVGSGEYAEYGTRPLENAIAVLDYNSQETWQRAFSMGARAVIFVGGAEATPNFPKHVGVPANLVRLYAGPEVLDRIDLRSDHAQATVVSHVAWKKATGRNVLAFLPGTDPAFARERTEPEMLVLSAALDSWGEVPNRAEGARGAANVAALLEAVRYMRDHRPRRDVLFVFSDGQAFLHEGMRTVYDALMRKTKLAQQLTDEHREQLAHVEKLIAALREDKEIIASTSPLQSAAVKFLMSTAYNRYSDLHQEMIALRIETPKGEKDSKGFLEQEKELQRSLDRWNDALGALDKAALGRIGSVWEELKARSIGHLEKSRTELEEHVRIDAQVKALQEKLAGRWIVLHAEYNLSDGGPCWGPVVGGDASGRSTVNVGSDAASSDNAGYYPTVFKALRAASSSLPSTSALQREVLKDPVLTAQYVPGRFISGNTVAGTFGIYNMALMTYHDGRLRDGHPADNLGNLDWRTLRRYAFEATVFMRELAQQEAISLPRVFSDLSSSSYSRWSNGRSTGYYVGLRVSGSLAEDRPATDAVLTAWPGGGTTRWQVQAEEDAIPGFNRFVLARIDGNGRFQLLGVRKDIFREQDDNGTYLAAAFDSLGRVEAISNQETIGKIFSVDMFPARGYSLALPLNALTEQTKILRAASDAAFREDRALYDASGMFTFFYVHPHAASPRVKVFQPFGAVFLGSSPKNPFGEGYALDMLGAPPPADEVTPSDLWQLNESRLSLLRAKGVVNVDLETIHSRAKLVMEKASRTDSVEFAQAAFAQSSELSRLVYLPVRMVMDDLIRAVVILLLLAIPFAFAVERLLVCATSVYTRLAGFGAAFLITFALMYFMHPGFQIASTPIIVFLAFMIILLTSLVIYIMMRKFRTELMAFQGRATSVHSAEISRMGTTIAAVNMGMSTMRRRPVRTFLTCVTVIMLTFTILCFSSFSSRLGVRMFYEGPVASDMKATFLVHHLDYGKMTSDVLRLLRGREGSGGLLTGHWWRVKELPDDVPFSVSRLDDAREVFVDGIMGVAPEELLRWDALAGIFEGGGVDEKMELLRIGGVFLPTIMRDHLGVEPGDSLLIDGRKTAFAGVVAVGALQRLKNLDGRSVLPVDFQDVTYKAVNVDRTQSTTAMTGGMAEMTQRDYMRLSANQVAITSADVVRHLGGKLHIVSVYAGDDIEAGEEGERLAELTSQPVWVRGEEGIQRLVFTRLAEVTGGFALFIPVVLGGLIIFGTLLGSITDRQREIYTFSALGLSPGHVGFLFFAEAAVYAIIGGLGGMLLAQGLALGASRLADMGYIQQASINFSSTNSLAAIAIVMATVLVSAIYPALRASQSANPGVQRSWKMPPPKGDVLEMTFPFTVSAYDITGVVSFLAEHFKEHDDAGLGLFAAQDVRVGRDKKGGHIQLMAHVSLAPFDLGIAQDFTLLATPSEIPGIDEVTVRAMRVSGSIADWKRANRVFVRDLRKQFLLWRTLSADVIEQYRMMTLQSLGEVTGEEA